MKNRAAAAATELKESLHLAHFESQAEAKLLASFIGKWV
jgi:hypothetical protein